MSRPVITAIMLDAARDWLKDNALPVTWEENGQDGAGRLAVVMDPSLVELRLLRTMLDRRGGLADVIEPADRRRGIPAATRRLCGKVARREVARGVAFVQDGALPVCIANKYNGIRAALGVNVPMVEEAVRSLGINVLVLEYPTLTTYQMNQMIDRLMAGATSAPPEIAATIEIIEQGGGCADW